MRPPVDAERIEALAELLGRAAQEETTLYLTDGATAVVVGWRPSTADADIRLEPDPDRLMRRVSEAKEELRINIELASPPDFVPELAGWRERSPFVLRARRSPCATSTSTPRRSRRSSAASSVTSRTWGRWWGEV